MEPVSRQTVPVLEKTYQFMLWLITTVDKFTRAQKFLLGDRIQNSAPVGFNVKASIHRI